MSKSQSYSLLPAAERHDSQETLLEKADDNYGRPQQKNRSWSMITRLTIVLQSILIVILTAAVVLLARSNEFRPRNFSTDFGILSILIDQMKSCLLIGQTGHLGDLIPYTKRTFTNPIYPKPDLSGLEIQWEEDAPRFVGTPRAELDDNWDELLSVTTFNLSGPVAQPAHGQTHAFEDGNYVMGLEVYHALHCVNAIRMYIFPDNYEFREKKSETELHKHHCIDYLRQYVQCNADLTPMYAEWMGAYRLVLKPYATHTCRDFSKIQEWIEENVEESQRSGEVL
ncbi:hypothetical protein AC579_736 [Pseudocercospora musae]|uniref:Cyclochlorotine biosynthesis protein O n=1 Tax=Pseudocercospora musae TaxID=113226 RepID=A0A139IA20_9PEZI|nr:hypothetical protein AC579_736 [Pseudocercospora musae]